MYSHDLGLVGLSLLAAVVAGYAALDLAQRAARATDRGERRRRLILAAVVMGLGIWSMHFVAMLSLDLGFPVGYEPLLVFLSMVAAVLGAGVALRVVTSGQAGLRSVFLGAGFMGLAVGAMHYIGMASMEMPAMIDWSVPLVLLSLVIAYLASLLALGLVFSLHAGQRWHAGPLALAAVAFGVAVTGLHYMGMFAATFVELDTGPVVAGGGDTELIAVLLAIAAAVMLVVLMFGASIDRQRAAFAGDLTVVSEMMRDVVQSQNARESICAAAAELAGARYVALLEPGRSGLLVRTASHGADPAPHGVGDAQATLDAGRRRFRPGEGGSYSTLYEPITVEEGAVGVLFLVFPYSLRRLSDRAVTIASLLAAEASFAIDRSDMLSKLERQASTDELTGLPNRRMVRAELDRQLGAADVTSAVAAVMLDLDHFKSYNDRFGHQGGDRLLVAAATGWTAQLRGPDLIGRYGGEEFLVVLPDCDLKSALATADRLRGALPSAVTCSAGVALWDGEETDESLIARADAALYEAKRRGRDRTEAAAERGTAPIPAAEPAYFEAVAREVAESSASDAKLAQAHSQFAGAFEAAAIGMALVSLDGRFLAVNPALCSLLRRDAEWLIQHSFQELTHPDDLGADLDQLERTLAGEIDSYRLSKRYLLPDGAIVWGLLTVSVVRDEAGRPIHFVSQIQDIADRKTAEGELERYTRQLEALSDQDPLTGLGNRRTVVSALSEELSVLAAGGEPSSLLLIAVAGDETAITAAATATKEAARGGDLVAHLGGGELAVLLSGVGADDAERIAGRARATLVGLPARCSVVTAERGDEPAALLERARQALSDPARAVAASDAPQRVRSLLELARRQLGMPLSFLTRLEGEDYVFERIAGESSQFGISEGAAMPLDGSHCVRMLDGRIGSVVHDLASEPETRDLEVTKALSLRAYAGVPVRLSSGEVYGTLCAVDTRPHPELSDRQTELLSFVSELTADAIESAERERAARDAETKAVGIRALLVALEARDYYTGEHSKEVVRLASAVARRLSLSDDEVSDVEQVALLHDVGKVGIPDSVLQKQGPLSEVEWQLMRQHPVVGERIIVGTPGLSHLATAMRAEHERWDGGGYPDGLAKTEIPIASRIALACDAFHAMTSDRPYRPAMTVERACEEIRACAGTQFDPDVAAAVLTEIEFLSAGVADPGEGGEEPAPAGSPPPPSLA